MILIESQDPVPPSVVNTVASERKELELVGVENGLYRSTESCTSHISQIGKLGS